MPFYIREAWLLDERKFREWLDLFTDDVLYFMPRRKNVPRRESHRELTPPGDLAILEEDKRYLSGDAGGPTRHRNGLGRIPALPHPPPYRQSGGGAAGKRRRAGQDRIPGVPLAPGD